MNFNPPASEASGCRCKYSQIARTIKSLSCLPSFSSSSPADPFLRITLHWEREAIFISFPQVLHRLLMRRFEELAGSQQFIADGVACWFKMKSAFATSGDASRNGLTCAAPPQAKMTGLAAKSTCVHRRLSRMFIRIRLHSGENSLLNLIRQNGRPPLDHVGDVIIFILISKRVADWPIQAVGHGDEPISRLRQNCI